MKEEFTIRQFKMSKLCRKSIKNCLGIAGVTVFSLGINSFVAYNHIVPGGITGLATVINYLFHIPIGTVTFFINVPLLIAAYVYLGKHTVVYTGITVIEQSLILNMAEKYMPVYHGNLLICSILGGCCMGAGLSMILISGSTTGGGDLLGKIIQKKNPGLSMGKILFMMDVTVITFSMFVFRKIQPAMFGIITMGVSAGVLDRIMFIYEKLCYKMYMKSE